MAKDFIPQKDSELIFWLIALSENLDRNGASYGLSAADITAGKDACAAIKTAVEEHLEARKTAMAKRSARTESKRTHGRTLRRVVNRMKLHPAFGMGNAKAMNLAAHKEPLPDSDFRPVFKPKLTGGRVDLYFKKLGAKGMMVYGKLKQEEKFEMLRVCMRSPFVDTRPLAHPDVPETRQYKMVALGNDGIIGQYSEVVSVVLAE
jgi:hypothetical protein